MIKEIRSFRIADSDSEIVPSDSKACVKDLESQEFSE